MRITIIGGSQGTGAQLASLAQAAGHEVTVLSRSGTAPEGVRNVTGNATDPDAAARAVAGADAVVVTVGGAKGVHHQRDAVTRTVIGAMRAEGVRRLVVQSSLGAGDSASQLPGPLGLITRIVLAKALADHDAQESAVSSSGLDWTILRPTGLTGKEPSGTWQILETTDNGKLKGSIPRADLAACMLGLLTDDSTVGKALGVSS
ncbi:NAD(P)-dependent oxidoreductase [Arthrobacter sp. zg-Y1110]|uniref:NAD(P)-dependent oxidoreductase n=1 Tax=Arthrobacter sp. zg-Y1110 TaxID=2886932 RepID=UPI001D13EBEC|nr:NAD(P)-binding oxidoreductase [Arthrobacter sp. zg-Y1110]MCC3290365.1 SDR family oxidoreductase [Arthrobacter sp. zg-Y1110]UWX84261.1 SDR family oxidoreductase [Arthrobacter sp. zg-Y1110]